MKRSPAPASGSNRRARGLGLWVLPGVLLVVAVGCGGTVSEEVPLPPATGKLIEVMLWDVKSDTPIGYHERRTAFARNELPAEYTVLAAMPESGPLDSTYSLAFEVNGQRQSIAEFEPYFLTRIRQGEAAPWSSGPGVFVVRAIAYEGKGATGAVMGTAAVRFEIR